MRKEIDLPDWWAGASQHARACWMVVSHHARDYNDARRKVGAMERTVKRPKVSVAEYQQDLARKGLD